MAPENPRFWVPYVMRATIGEAVNRGARAIMFLTNRRSPLLWNGHRGPFAYFDESGGINDPVMTMAGFVSTPVRWGMFWQDWNDVLDKPQHRSARGGPMPEAHYSAAISQREGGDHEGWGPKRVIDFFNDLTPLIRRHVLFGVSVSVVVPDYKQEIIPKLPPKHPFHDPYMWLMQSCLDEIKNSKHLGPDDRVFCQFDAGHSEAKSQEYFLTLTEPTRNPRGPIARSGRFVPVYTATHSINSPPIQAADFLVGATRRGTNLHLQGLTGNEVLIEFLDTGKVPIEGGYFDAASFRKLNAKVDQLAKEYAEEQSSPASGASE